MHVRLNIVCVAAFTLLFAACGGSGGGGGGEGARNTAADETGCPATGCDSGEQPAAPLVCGGTGRAACPDGYRCVDDPANACTVSADGTDCSGLCVLGSELPACGGLDGSPCPDGYLCVDDPNDSCAATGADCPGTCQPAPPPEECTSDADCPALRAACSVCPDGTESCPAATCDHGRCSVTVDPCQGPPACAGIAGLPCPSGFQCIDDPNDDCDPERGGADCGGICVPADLRCNGLAGIACPDGYVCVDDPADECDPNSGGADCFGVCVPGSIGECQTDADCPPVRAPCSVCADGTTVCPRTGCEEGRCIVTFPSCPPPVACNDSEGGCAPGYVCADDRGDNCDPTAGDVDCQGICVSTNGSRPCGGIVGETCPSGYECVDDPGDDCQPDASGTDCSGICQPVEGAECRADEDCPQLLLPCPVCPDGTSACPHSYCDNGKCQLAVHTCEAPGFCGGIAGFSCPPGYTCIDDPRDDCDPSTGGADCGGLCVREDEPGRCGGLAGETCPEGYECVDDPRDDCDPATGGADCTGFCRPLPPDACTSDSDCPLIGAPCRLCPDGNAACPSSTCVNGACRVDFPTCENQCQTDADCPQIDALCHECSDGTTACPSSTCVDGECRFDFPVCPNLCTSDADCPQIEAPCRVCPDGTTACPGSFCVNGECRFDFAGCPEEL